MSSVHRRVKRPNSNSSVPVDLHLKSVSFIAMSNVDISFRICCTESRQHSDLLQKSPLIVCAWKPTNWAAGDGVCKLLLAADENQNGYRTYSRRVHQKRDDLTSSTYYTPKKIIHNCKFEENHCFGTAAEGRDFQLLREVRPPAMTLDLGTPAVVATLPSNDRREREPEVHNVALPKRIQNLILRLRKPKF